MGNNPPPVKQPTMEQTIIQLKMTSRRFANQSKKAQKEQKENIKKAKAALKKNNQQGAKMYLTAAASKKSQCLNLQRMSIKMDNLVTTVKSGNSNQILMTSFNKITNILNYAKQPNIEIMAGDLQKFENCMDEMMINGKVMDQMLNKNSNADLQADSMMQNLKKQMALQTQTQLNQAGKLRQKQQKDQQFLNNLKNI